MTVSQMLVEDTRHKGWRWKTICYSHPYKPEYQHFCKFPETLFPPGDVNRDRGRQHMQWDVLQKNSELKESESFIFTSITSFCTWGRYYPYFPKLQREPLLGTGYYLYLPRLFAIQTTLKRQFRQWAYCSEYVQKQIHREWSPNRV